MEKAFIWGDAVESTGAAGLPLRGTGGILSFLTTNKGNATFDQAGTLTEPELDTIMEAIFRYGSNQKLILAGSTLINAFSFFAKKGGNINLTPMSTTYGMAISEYRSPFGSLMIKNHPLFSQHPVWRGNGLIIDPQNIIYRPLDDTKFIKNRQNNGDDASKDEFLTECGLEVHFEETHGYITGVTGGA
jgi:hypothetical protein